MLSLRGMTISRQQFQNQVLMGVFGNACVLVHGPDFCSEALTSK